LQEVAGPWSVQFDPKWFYPTGAMQGEQAAGKFTFGKLDDWATRPEAAIKYFKRHSHYRTNLTGRVARPKGRSIFLDFGHREGDRLGST